MKKIIVIILLFCLSGCVASRTPPTYIIIQGDTLPVQYHYYDTISGEEVYIIKL